VPGIDFLQVGGTSVSYGEPAFLLVLLSIGKKNIRITFEVKLLHPFGLSLWCKEQSR
jgi:hypothetical protein